jgi:hypothetical protein
MLAVVQTEFRYRGRNISGAEIESIRQVIAVPASVLTIDTF